MSTPLTDFDDARREGGVVLLCGVDEVGRGPLAGPVVAAAVVLDPDRPVAGLDDSKKLSAKRRAALEAEIYANARAACVASLSPEQIDAMNILQASLRAMERAVEGLGLTPGLVLVDGNKKTLLALPQETVVGGDGRSASIAAASIIAKQARDRIMVDLDRQYPGYGLARHMGYPTKAHKEALRRLGPTPIHRKTFRGVAELVSLSEPPPLPLGFG